MPQYISKLILNGVTQMDVTQDTVAANNLLSGETATKNDGSPVSGSIGTMTLPSSTSSSSAGSFQSDIYPSESTKYLNLGAGYNSTAKYYRMMPMVIQDTTITRNGVYNPHDADNDGWGTVTVAVPESTFVVTISYDSQDDTWKPDCTFAQAQAAYAAGKTIVVVTDSPGSSMVDGQYIDEGGGEEFLVYAVGEVIMDEYIIKYYVLDSNGIQDDGDSTYIYPNFETVTKTYTPTASSQTETVTFDSNTYNGLQQVNVTVNATPAATFTNVQIPGSDYTDTWDNSSISVDSDGLVTATINKFGSVTSFVDSAGYADSSDSHGVLMYFAKQQQLSTQAATTITPTTSSQTAVAAGKYTTGAVTVAAMPSGTATPAASISGTSATVTTGTNTLTLSKTVSNTPHVSAGYVSSGTAGNSSVSLTANVTTKAATTYHPSASQQTIASGTYLTGTQTINAVTTTNLTAENIKNGVTVTVGDSSDPDSVTSVTGTYSGGGSSKNVQAYFGRAQRTANSYGATALTVTVAKTGTYNVYWTAWRSSSSGTMGTNLHRNNTSGTNQQTFTGTYGQNITLTNQSYTQGDVLTLYATSGSNSRSIYVANLIIEEQ